MVAHRYYGNMENNKSTAAPVVRIYTTATCVYCKMAKEFFTKHNVAYSEVDVLHGERARDEMFAKSHQLGVPVIEIGNEIFVGFNRPELERALGL